MPDLANPQGLGDRLAELERRLASLERANRLAASSLPNGGVVTFTDDDGVPTAGGLGAVAPGTFGLDLRGTNGLGRFRVTDVTGVGAGAQAGDWNAGLATAMTSTSATYSVAFSCQTVAPVANAGVCIVAVSVPASTAAQIRLRCPETGASVASPSLPEGTSWVSLVLVHGVPMNPAGLGGLSFTLDHRRVSGTGTVSTFQPTGLVQRGTTAGSAASVFGSPPFG